MEIEYRWAEGRYERLPGLAADLVRRRVTVIFAQPGISGQAAKAATTSIPIVFVSGIDPITYGLVTSLNRPGGNLTGVSVLSVELGPKRLELLHELVPTATTVALLTNPTTPADNNGPNISERDEAAARSIGVKLLVLHAASERDFDAAFTRMVEERAGALLIAPDPFLTARSAQLAALTARHSMPAMFARREGAAAGGLASYASNDESARRLAGSYVGRILKGEKPGELPVQQSTKVDLVLNLRTAKALGITVPLPVLGLADEVIE